MPGKIPIEPMPHTNYTPYIHATTSATLAAMAKANFQLMPLLKMIDDYQMAPLAGGGYSSLPEELVESISFGQLKMGNYDLKQIKALYTQFDPPTTLKQFNEELANSMCRGFSNLNLLLLYFTRARQMYPSLDQVISENALERLNQQLQATVQFYYFIQLLGTHIHPDYKAVETALAQSKSLEKRDISDAIYSLLDIEHIIQKIMLQKIDMKDIVLHPTEENLKKALQILKLPSSATIQSGTTAVKKEIQLPITQFFSLNKTSPREVDEEPFMEADGKRYYKGDRNHLYNSPYPQKDFGYFTRNIRDFNINSLLEKLFYIGVGSNYFVGLGQEAKKHIFILEDRIRLLDKLVQASPEDFKITGARPSLVKPNFPVIFVSESEHIKPFSSLLESFSSQPLEFRCTVPLKLGNDIRVIATNTKTNRDKLKNYCHELQLDPIQVMLFDDLERASNNKSSLPLSIDSQALRNLLTKTKNNKHYDLFYKFYISMDNLNDKRNEFRTTNPQLFTALNVLLSELDKVIDASFSTAKPITEGAIRTFCIKSNELIQQQKPLFEQHRGVLGLLDTLLEVLASLVIFYPIVYWYKKSNQIQHTFFNTNTGNIAQDTMTTLRQINVSAASDFPEEEMPELGGRNV